MDAEVLLDAGGRGVLAGLCGVGLEVLARALPSWGGRRRPSARAVWPARPRAIAPPVATRTVKPESQASNRPTPTAVGKLGCGVQGAAGNAGVD
jgi:hypothetical protein